MKNFKKEVRKTSRENSMSLEELRSLVVNVMVEKNKGASSFGEGGIQCENRGSQANTGDSRGLLPNPLIC